MNKKIAAIVFVTALAIATTVSAHVIVTPNQAGIAAFQTFTVGVPVEKNIPTTGVRLVLPVGLNEVYPNAKPGWKITEKENGTGDGATVTEIDWTGGSIPAGQRDEFLFSAQVPETPTILVWKAYQTYQDGSVVAWDTDGGAETATTGPYSTTTVIDDLTPVKPVNYPLIISIVALGLAITALVRIEINNKKR